MKKFYSLLVLLLLGMMVSRAAETTFGSDFSSSNWTTVTADEEYTMTSGDITLTYEKGGNNTSPTQGQQSEHLRVYKNSQITLSSAAGNITEVTFTVVSGYDAKDFTVSGTALTSATWSGDAESVTFVASKQVRVSMITVTYEDGGETSGYKAPTILINGEAPATRYLQSELPIKFTVVSNNGVNNPKFYYCVNGNVNDISSGKTSGEVELNLGDRSVYDLVLGSNTLQVQEWMDENGSELSPVATVSFSIVSTVSTLAEVNALDDHTAFTFSGRTVVLGKKNRNMYIADADNSAGTLMYSGSNWGDDFTFGKEIAGGWSGTKTTYFTKPEVTGPSDVTLTGNEVTLTPIEITAADLTLANFGRYAVLRSAESTGSAITDNTGASVVTFNQFEVDVPTEGTYDLYGVIGWNNDVGQFMILNAEAVGGTPQPTTYTVNISADIVNGSVTADPAQAESGTTVTLTVTPDNGYKLDLLEVNSVDGAPIETTAGETEGVYTFTMPEGDVTVSATFVEEGGEEPVGDGFVLVTSANDLTNGTYLIVWNEGSLAMNGGLTDNLDAVGNSIEVTISNGVIEATEDALAAAFTYDSTAGTFKGAGGLYMGQTSDANGMQSSAETAYENAVSLNEDDNSVNIVSGGAYLRYNKAQNQTRFRYYKSSTYSSQQPVHLYKLAGGETPEPVMTVAKPIISGETPFYGSTTVTITCETEGAEIHYFMGATALATADSPVYTGPFEISEATTVSAIAILDGVESEVAIKEFATVNTVSSIAELAALDDNTEVYFAGRAIALAQSGKNLYVQDDDKGMLIFGDIDPTYTLGDVIPAGFHGIKTVFRSQLEMISPAGLEPAVDNVYVTPLEAGIADVNAENFGRYAVLRGATVTESTVAIGDESVTLYTARNFCDMPEDLDATYDVYGIIGIFNQTLQFLPMQFVLNEPVLEPHAIVLDIVGQGAIEGAPGDAPKDEVITFSLVAEEGWRVKELKATYADPTGEPVELECAPGDAEGIYSFTMPDAEVTIHATFEQYVFAITAAECRGGAIEVDAEAEVGATVTFELLPEDYYVIGDIHVTYNDATGTPVELEYQVGETEGVYSFTMPAADVTISAEFNRMPQYGITTYAENAQIEIDVEAAHEGDNVEFTVVVEEPFELVSVGATYIDVTGNVDDPIEIELQGPDENNRYSFTMPAGRVTITAVAAEMFEHMTLAEVLETGVVGETYIIDTDIAVYSEGVTQPGMGSMFFATDNEDIYFPLVVTEDRAVDWPVAGLAQGFKATPLELNGVKVLLFVDGDVADLEYAIEPVTVDKEFEPVDNKVYRVNGYIQEIDGEFYLTEFSGKYDQIYKSNVKLMMDYVDIDADEFILGERYEFIAVPILKSAIPAAPRRAQSTLNNYELIVLSPTVDALTGIGTLIADDVVKVTYVNAAGVTSDKPFDGLNIVVSQHADGSVTAVKVLK